MKCLGIAAALSLFLGTAASAATRTVAAGENLQAVLDAAQPGDVILLQAGATFEGKYSLPPKTNPDGLYITVRSSAPDAALPSAGTRIGPGDAALLAKIRSSDALQAIDVPAGASYWRLLFLELQANVGGTGDIIRIGTNTETVPANQPHHIVMDRVYVHGDPVSGQRNGIVAHASHFELRDSYVSDIKHLTQEAHAFISYNGPGPYVIENNYLEASGINVLFGGADPRNAGMIPSAITFERNHVAKNLAWIQARPDGRFWNVKNLFELKAGRNVTIKGNLFENNWHGAGDQAGYAILMRTENQSGNCTWCETGHVTFTDNIVRHSPGGVSLNGLDFPGGGAPLGVRMHDVTFRNNLFDDISTDAWSIKLPKSGAKFVLINGVDRLTWDHNTIIMPVQTSVLYFTGSAKSHDFVYTNNTTEHKSLGVKGDDKGIGKATLDFYTVNYLFTGNVLAGGSAGSYPPGNCFPAVAIWKTWFVDYARGDYRRAPPILFPQPCPGAGADPDLIEAATIGPPNHSQHADVVEDESVLLTLPEIDVAVRYALHSPPSHGALTGVLPLVTYTPDPNHNGPDGFAFRVVDEDGRIKAYETVTLTVASVNDPPTAAPLSMMTSKRKSIVFRLPVSDVDGDPLVCDVPSSLPSGTLTPIGDCTYIYTPNAGFVGTDWFEYCVTDPSGARACAIATLTVVNMRPIAKDQRVPPTSEDAAVTFTLDAIDPDDDPLTYKIILGPTSGTLSGMAPELTYTPKADFNGRDEFRYTVTDTDGETSNPATVVLTVDAVNDPPQAMPAPFETASNTALAIVLTASDVDGQALTWLVTAPRAGTVSGEPPDVTYTPGADFAGIDQFAFTVFDGLVPSTAMVTITVTGTPLTITTTSLGDEDGEFDDDDERHPMTVQAIGGSAPYTWSVVDGALPPGLRLDPSTGQISGTPPRKGSRDTYRFTVRVTDRWGDVDQQALRLRIQ